MHPREPQAVTADMSYRSGRDLNNRHFAYTRASSLPLSRGDHIPVIIGVAVGGMRVAKTSNVAIIGEDLFITGEVRNGGRVVVAGTIEGTLSASEVVIRPSGRILGTLIADNAEIDGDVRGHVLVRQLLQIGSTGRVHGDVRYGQITMQTGADLSADLRNVPPSLGGDLSLTMKRGGSVIITTEDLTAVDPDSPVASLAFSVTRQTNGFVARSSSKTAAIDQFTQPELMRNDVLFVHDGSATSSASFDVIVRDQTGETSGAPKTVQVTVLR
jgi:cytoskeletal protein CcmA (bactofilin family)